MTTHDNDKAHDAVERARNQALEELINAGHIMSNVAFNATQGLPGAELLALLKQCQRDWDAARAKYNEALQSAPVTPAANAGDPTVLVTENSIRRAMEGIGLGQMAADDLWRALCPTTTSAATTPAQDARSGRITGVEMDHDGFHITVSVPGTTETIPAALRTINAHASVCAALRQQSDKREG